jgi:metal-responsive CopG/Arc/MetJ family transcriptional regulator
LASGDDKTTHFTASLSNTLLDLLDWLCAEQEYPTTRSQMLAACLERELHRYVLENRPDLAIQTSVVRKQRFYQELRSAIGKGER